MSDSPVPPDLDPVHGRTDDPLSADRRVLVIGAVSMVVLILVGVVSASVFTRSACGQIAPDPMLPRTAGADVEAVLSDGLPDLFDDERAALAQYLGEDLAGRLGELTAAVDVTGATGLGPAGADDARRVAATGQTTTVFDAATGDVHATTTVGDGVVVGDGTDLYSLQLTNPATGQTDAIIPLDGELEGGDCIDTATVGTPFAFLLGAGDGQLLLFRVEEDGATPQVELRDADRGDRWRADLPLPQMPPGVAGERLDAAMDAETVVVGRRFGADDEEVVLSGFGRDAGEARWTVPVEVVAQAAPPGDGPVWVDVVTVDGDTAVVGLARDAARDAGTIAAFDTADGALRWVADTDPAVPVDAHVDEHAVTVLAHVAGEAQALYLDADDGAVLGAAAHPLGDEAATVDDDDGGQGAPDVRGAVVPLDGQVLATAGRGILLVGGGEIAAVGRDAESVARIIDAVALPEATVLLLTSADGAVAVTFAAS